MDPKQAVHDFWNKQSCGEALCLRDQDYQGQSQHRYELEPYIIQFADFGAMNRKQVLEIGTGLGADHQKFAEAGAILSGVDLTSRAIEHTKRRFQLLNLTSRLYVADAESLPFESNSFDVVYSWGVLHHSPDTEKSVSEVFRVLRSGGIAKVMIYHRHSCIALMLWIRYALLQLRPLRKVEDVFANHMESPGTKAYSTDEARQLFCQFRTVKIRTVLSHGDLLTSQAGQRHRGLALSIARRVWPRSIIKRLFPRCGLFMMIEAEK